MRKAEANAIFWLAVIGLPIFGIYKFGEAIGWWWFAAIAGFIVSLYFLNQASEERERKANREARRTALLEKYGDAKLVELIMSGSVWEGQTAEQVKDSVGEPEAIDEKVLKTKKKEVWKYGYEGGNRYNLRVTLDNDAVVGWDKRN
jgi:hypothetical protein